MLAVIGAFTVTIFVIYVVGTAIDGLRHKGHRNYDHPDMLGSGDDDF